MDIINKTGIQTKNKGDSLSSSDFNKINGTVNQSVEANNLYLKTMFDANLELGTGITKKYTLEEVIALVPEARKRVGIKVRFLDSTGFYDEQVFLGRSVETDDWFNTENWRQTEENNIIDGGEW